MRYFRIIWRLLIVLIVGTFLDYNLPQQDIAYVTSAVSSGTEVTFGRINRHFYSAAEGPNVVGEKRQVALVLAVRKRTYLFGLIRGSDQPYAYRNEDTGIWPPYFKFDTSNLQSAAAAVVSSSDAPKWVVIRHYGWRGLFFSMYPNAIDIRPIPGPDYRPIPWFNIIFFILLIAAFFFLRAMWRQFRERTVDPAMEAAGDRMDHIEAGVKERQSRFSRWMGTWTGKK